SEVTSSRYSATNSFIDSALMNSSPSVMICLSGFASGNIHRAIFEFTALFCFSKFEQFASLNSQAADDPDRHRPLWNVASRRSQRALTMRALLQEPFQLPAADRVL